MWPDITLSSQEHSVTPPDDQLIGVSLGGDGWDVSPSLFARRQFAPFMCNLYVCNPQFTPKTCLKTSALRTYGAFTPKATKATKVARQMKSCRSRRATFVAGTNVPILLGACRATLHVIVASSLQEGDLLVLLLRRGSSPVAGQRWVHEHTPNGSFKSHPNILKSKRPAESRHNPRNKIQWKHECQHIMFYVLYIADVLKFRL